MRKGKIKVGQKMKGWRIRRGRGTGKAEDVDEAGEAEGTGISSNLT
jgi:hypothetical protein